MKPVCLLIIGFLTTVSTVSVANDRTFYNIKATIIPESQHLEVALELDYVHPSTETDSVEFLLHKNLVIESLTGSRIKDFSCRNPEPSEYPFTPEARIVSLELETPLLSGEHLQIAMKYAGSIGVVGEWETNRITEEWIELGNYTPWFPYHPGTNEIGFQVELSIGQPYRVTANGRTTEKNGNWRIWANVPDNDIVLTASRNTETRVRGDDDPSFAVHWATNLDDSTVEDMLDQGLAILERYKAWFGHNESARGSILISPRKKGGGYARKNLLVLSAIRDEDYFDKKNGYVRYFAHELAHLWWHRARSDSWHDWLNESLAEYSALMIIRELAGEEEFADRLKTKKNRISGLPPLRHLDRRDEDAYSVLYDKGPVFLHDLEQRVGRIEFIKFLRSAFLSGVTSTEQFLSLLEKEFDADTMAFFSKLLDR